MPVTRIGRYVAASPAELERWTRGRRESDRSHTCREHGREELFERERHQEPVR